jgi:hypothetical protein
MVYTNRKKCCVEHNDIIKGRRMSDLESNIFHYWVDVLYIIDKEELDRILEKHLR